MSALRQERSLRNRRWVRSRRIRRYDIVLALERRGGRVGGGPAMLVRPVAKNSHYHGIGDCSSARKSLSSQSTFGPKRWTVGDGSFRRPTRTRSQHHISSARGFNKIRQKRSFLSAQPRL